MAVTRPAAWAHVSGEAGRLLCSAERTGPVSTSFSFGEQFLSQGLAHLALSVALFKLSTRTSVVGAFSLRLRNLRCPFGSTSVSAPRRDGLGEVIIASSASVLLVA